MTERRHRSRRLAAALVFVLGSLWQRSATAQEQSRQTVEIGASGQTTEDLVTPPYSYENGVGESFLIGLRHEQAFGGPQIGYRYAFTRNFSLEGRAEYLFGHQPTLNLTGGNEFQVHAGIRASAPLGRFTFFARVAPGFSSFGDASRFVQPGAAQPIQHGRITHFSVENAVGITHSLGSHNALSFSVSQLTLIEGDAYLGFQPNTCTAPVTNICTFGGPIIARGGIEEHLIANVSVEHSFGHFFVPGTKPARSSGIGQHLGNQLLFLWVNQPQAYLPQAGATLVASNGFGGALAHAVRPWLDVDGAAMILPGGDAAGFQEGGSKTEVFVGVKAGLRRRYYGVFAKVRPGFVTSPDTLNSELANGPYVRNFNIALDTGAVIEIYPSASHFVMRLDLGDVSTRFAAVRVTTPSGYAGEPVQYREGGLFTLGVGWRF